ncbi:MAG TPA: exodeoxyribonuclease VII small subunit [Candidatus Binatia bacterium]|nr:exodeoxyribonuclease VII small subunit [Candidatus Binatia bacterium]
MSATMDNSLASGTSGDVEALSYERALGELDQIIERLERGAVALDEAIAAYERGARLAQHCARLLDRTEQKISQLVVGAGGRISERTFEPERPDLEAAMELGAPSPPIARRLPVDPDDIPF